MEEECDHEFISRDYLSAPYGRCICCGQLIIDSLNNSEEWDIQNQEP